MFGAGVSEKYAQMITQKTGLTAQGERMVGWYQSLPAWTQTQMVADHMSSLRGGGGLLGGAAGLFGGAGGMAHAMTGGDFFMKHDYVVELTGSNLPGASIRESSSFLNDKTYQRRGALGTRCSSGVAWIDQKLEVHSTNPDFIRYVCASQELQQAVHQWPYLNLSWNGPQVWLELLDSGTRIHGKFGTAAMQNGDMVVWGLNVVAAAARATFAR